MKRAEEQYEQGKPAEVQRVSEEEILSEIDRETRRRLGMSGEEFAEAHRKGLLPDTPAVNELGIVLDSVRGAFVRA